ncbi:MAG TPA: MarC family protein [bacterium]|nr:MarC family protein [bacterium]
MEFLSNFLKAFIPMFVAVDIIGVLPFFVKVTQDMNETTRRGLIKLSVLTATLITIVFVFVGKALFSFLTIQISDFMIAGGAVIFIISTHDLISAEKSNTDITDISAGVVPIGTPLLAGPAVLATALIVNKPYGLSASLTSIIVNFLIAGIAFLYSKIINKLLGKNGSMALSKIMTLVMGAYGIMMMRQGIVHIIQSIK